MSHYLWLDGHPTSKIISKKKQPDLKPHTRQPIPCVKVEPNQKKQHPRQDKHKVEKTLDE
jgi:hypothetical protein